MCGIVGLLDPGCSRSGEELQPAIERMRDSLLHRGPDDAGTWMDAGAGIALGHRRLSIIDLSAEGHQPMASASGRWVLVYNGEIYNHPELRTELEQAGSRFRGHSDTEVVVEAVDRWGLLASLERFNGMFAFALWDRRDRELHLVRDRLGIKPLYYGRCGGELVFASELRALRAHPRFASDVDRGAVALLLRHNHVPAPYSIYEGIRKLAPGSLLTIAHSATGLGDPQVWWSARQRLEAATPFQGNEQEGLDCLEGLLRDAVNRRMVADVPLGAFLSGGIDSSIVVALMQAQARRPVRTFSIGFDVAAYDESPYARRVAEHLGCDHTDLMVTAEDALEVVPRLAELWDEPFGDSSQIPTFLVSQLARRDVTVSLSGDGGDEVFWGYRRYLWAREIRGATAWLPASVRRALGEGAKAVVPERGMGKNVHRVAGLLPAEDRADLYRRLMSHWQQPETLVLDAREPATVYSNAASWPSDLGYESWMAWLDTVAYLPDDLLVKLDRASMAVGLEARVPLLDHRVVEWAFGLPATWKRRGRTGKWLLRQVLHRHVPAELVERPKMGFGVPLGEWLRGGLRSWAEDLLDEDRLRRQGLLAPGPIRAAWQEHVSGRRDLHHDLWIVLVLQAWLAEVS